MPALEGLYCISGAAAEFTVCRTADMPQLVQLTLELLHIIAHHALAERAAYVGIITVLFLLRWGGEGYDVTNPEHIVPRDIAFALYAP